MRAIDADALKERIRKVLAVKSLDNLLPYEKRIVQQIDNMPAIEERKTGKWICSDDLYETAICSCCGWDTTEPYGHIRSWFRYCPRCGARLVQEGEDNG